MVCPVICVVLAALCSKPLRADTAGTRPGVIFTDDATLQAVSDNAGLRSLLNRASPQNIDFLLPNLDDPEQTLSSRDFTRIGASFNRLESKQKVLVNLWVGNSVHLTEMVAEFARLVRSRPEETEVAVFLITENNAKRAAMFSHLLVDRHDAGKLKDFVSGASFPSDPTSRAAAIVDFVEAFEKHLLETAHAREERGISVQGSRAEDLAKVTTGRSSEVATPGIGDVPQHEQQPVKKTFRLGKAEKLFALSICAIFVPILWSLISRIVRSIKTARRELPERTVLVRPGVPLFNAARVKGPARGPRMHPIEQRVNLRPRSPFKPR
jgi:hypothetical protein